MKTLFLTYEFEKVRKKRRRRTFVMNRMFKNKIWKRKFSGSRLRQRHIMIQWKFYEKMNDVNFENEVEKDVIETYFWKRNKLLSLAQRAMCWMVWKKYEFFIVSWSSELNSMNALMNMFLKFLAGFPELQKRLTPMNGYDQLRY